jgi:4,5-DOPA dioxygenase extradiol
MPLVLGLYVPNAPNLIAPSVFGGAGGRTVDSLRGLDVTGRFRPEAVIVSSPHWVSADSFLVQGSATPEQLYDFFGFPAEISNVRYRPPGDPELARALVSEGTRRGISVRLTDEWGLDHGAWAPLLHLFPGANTPVVPVSIAHRSPLDHYRWGEAVGAVARVAEKRIAVLGTGSILHRLDRFSMARGKSWPEAADAEREVVELAVAGDAEGLARFDREKWTLLAPEGDLAPLFFTMGAMGRSTEGRFVSTEQVFGAAGMSILTFEPSSAPLPRETS